MNILALLVKESYCSGFGSISCRYEYEYDSKGNKVKEKFMKATIQDSLWKEFDRGVCQAFLKILVD